MPGRRHAYFAYGSNLCVRQMALRCPNAADPRPAVLSDHDWLINQRGVATVEPFAGTQVHGVLWHVSDHDLAALDGAEGVPVRYRRDRLTVHTDDGQSPAWVYIDHRVTPGPPRPGYLPRIIDGSVHGYGRIGRSTQLLAGGRNRALAAHLARHIRLTGYQVVTDIGDIPAELRGLHPNNPVNRVRQGGTQLELSVRVRGISPRSPLPGADGLSPVTSALVRGLVAAARSWSLFWSSNGGCWWPRVF